MMIVMMIMMIVMLMILLMMLTVMHVDMYEYDFDDDDINKHFCSRKIVII
jgi:hypothetical protein